MVDGYYSFTAVPTIWMVWMSLLKSEFTLLQFKVVTEEFPVLVTLQRINKQANPSFFLFLAPTLKIHPTFICW